MALQATWRSVRAAVRDLPGGADAQAADVEAMAALVPSVVLLRDRQRLPQCGPACRPRSARCMLAACCCAPSWRFSLPSVHGNKPCCLCMALTDLSERGCGERTVAVAQWSNI